MPAKNPRLTITMPPSLAAQLRRLSELTGNSQSAIISELLDGSQPVFSRMIQVLEAANDAKEAMRGRLVADMEHSQAKLERQLGLAMDTMNDVTRPLLDEAEAIKRRARRGGQAKRPAGTQSAGVTPLSNRGVRSTVKRSIKRG